jgi:hypothetical protein
MLCYDTIVLVIQTSCTWRNYFLLYLPIKNQSISNVKYVNFPSILVVVIPLSHINHHNPFVMILNDVWGPSQVKKYNWNLLVCILC